MNFNRCVLVAAFLLAAAARAQQPAPLSPEVRKELAALQGTWRLESYEGAKKNRVNLKTRELFIGADLFFQRERGKDLQIGQVRLMPAKSPRRMDVIVHKGLHAGNTMLGIYELKGDTLKVCFDPDGDSRPNKFGASDETNQFIAVYKRVKRADEQIEITGKFVSISIDETGKEKKVPVEIEKRGDGYFLMWRLDGKLAYVGSGIRTGNTLSVAYFTQGHVGLAVYQIEKGPKLVGSYTAVGGAGLMVADEMRPDTKDDAEVRNRR